MPVSVILLLQDWEGRLGLLFHPLCWAMAANVKLERAGRAQGVALVDVHTCMSSLEVC